MSDWAACPVLDPFLTIISHKEDAMFRNFFSVVIDELSHSHYLRGLNSAVEICLSLRVIDINRLLTRWTNFMSLLLFMVLQS